ncbi:sugar phosphate nucleotidyltransferase [Marivita sp. GX14005]|uniref:UTP--glucose-1-phosphate uridylyltransferase n=1 Tax=Marivita sp. GX14005 TaxID=2942276 RepID=UPI0020199F7B|nr:sugar phosphate nucleotidyltransferase [Marivita sp. GX14005]MCL3882688.1 sugar phosphate nucleotidyltransferase [Marivita sp. GX14005]
MTQLDTVILPIAGNGSRMRPATDAIAKELLPIYDTPLLQFALEEAVDAGARRIVLVTRDDKPGIPEYIDKLRARPGGLLDGVEVVFADQPEPLGLGHAVLCARGDALPGAVGVILPDDLILGAPALAEMCGVYDPASMSCLIAAQKVDPAEVGSYGIFDPEGAESLSGLLPARGLIEKPAPEDAPSHYAAVGRYILSDAIWDVLEQTRPGAGDEIQLTDAIAALGGISGFRFSGCRFDCGNKEGWFAATERFRRTKFEAEAMAAE